MFRHWDTNNINTSMSIVRTTTFADFGLCIDGAGKDGSSLGFPLLKKSLDSHFSNRSSFPNSQKHLQVVKDEKITLSGINGC